MKEIFFFIFFFFLKLLVRMEDTCVLRGVTENSAVEYFEREENISLCLCEIFSHTVTRISDNTLKYKVRRREP